MIKSNFKWAALLAVAVTTLVACGGGSSGGDGGAAGGTVASNLSASLTAANSAAIDGQTFSFPGAVPELGTTAATTVTITGSKFSIGSAGGTATGDMTYGSCIFTVTASTIPGLPAGAKKTINPCTLEGATAGVKADLSERSVLFALRFGAFLSGSRDFAIKVSPGGVVTIGSIAVGTVVFSTGTGSTN